MKKLSMIIGGLGFSGEKHEDYLTNFSETVLSNASGQVLEVKGFKDVQELRKFEVKLGERLYTRGDSKYLRTSDEENLKYTIKQK